MLLTFQAVTTYWTKKSKYRYFNMKTNWCFTKGKTMTTGCTRCRRRMKVYSARLAHRHEKRCVQTIHYNYSKSLKPWKNNIKRNIKSNIMSAWVFCLKNKSTITYCGDFFYREMLFFSITLTSSAGNWVFRVQLHNYNIYFSEQLHNHNIYFSDFH